MKKPETFHAHGHTWTKHAPGDPCPCRPEDLIEVIAQGELDTQWVSAEELGSWWIWDKVDDSPLDEIIGWRYATPQEEEKDELATLRELQTPTLHQMSTPTDYGEPWIADQEHIFTRDGHTVADIWCGDSERFACCVNACAGIPNPEEALRAAREALTRAEKVCSGSNAHAVSEACKQALSLLTPTKPAVVLTDPAKMAEVYAKPGTQSHAEAVSSILKQNLKP